MMREARLLLPKYGKKPTLRHDGKVITLASDMRRGRDIFEIRCWNGEKIHVGFSLDCCDREVMSWVAAAHHLDGEAVRDLMAGAVDVRFGTTVVPKPIEWLSDNGPPFTATKHDASAPTAVSLLRTRRRTRRNLMAWPKPSRKLSRETTSTSEMSALRQPSSTCSPNGLPTTMKIIPTRV